MPWHQEMKKEAEDCQKLRGAVNQAMIRRSLNGETQYGKTILSLLEHIEQGGERPELKHLSKDRKRKQRDSLSSGERNGKSLKLVLCKPVCVVVQGKREAMCDGY